MGANLITERQIIGTFYKALSQNVGAEWIGSVSNYFTSDQASETYAWLGMSPLMREWIGGRQTNGIKENSLTIRNKHYEATMEVLVRDLRRDKTGQIMVRIEEMARRANAHWAKLLTDLIDAGAATACYDGKYFFATDHEEGESGAQSNAISSDISEYPVIETGTTSLPAVTEMQYSIAKGIEAIAGFKDDKGQPMNEDAMSFLIMCPVTMMNVVMQAVQTPVQVAETQSALSALKNKFRIDWAVNARLGSGWASKFVIFRTDAAIKSLIRQEETGVVMKVKGAGSEFEFDNDAHQYGIDTWRNVGYGYWQNACQVTLT
jgi:phage major head subunit gpT-like protein